MHVRKILIVAVVLLSAVSICYGQEADTGNPAINYDLAVDYFGKYIKRGQNLVDDPVLQSNISVGYGKLTASQGLCFILHLIGSFRSKLV
jgi:hypothetical protein